MSRGRKQEKGKALLSSERFRITTERPPYGGFSNSDEITKLVMGKNDTSLPRVSEDQLQLHHITVDYEKGKNEAAKKLGLDNQAYRAKLMQRLNEQSFVQRNKRRTFNKNELMKRWVGTSINFEEPQVEKISVKPNKKIVRQAAVSHKLSVPDLIESQYNYKIDADHKIEAAPRFLNNDGKFIIMDGKRKVGRQRIPQEYLKREESLKKATMNRTILEPLTQNSPESKATVNIGPGKVDATMLQNLHSSIDKRHESPSLTPFADRNSLPYSASLRVLAEKSISALSVSNSALNSRRVGSNSSTTFGRKSNVIEGTSRSRIMGEDYSSQDFM